MTATPPEPPSDQPSAGGTPPPPPSSPPPPPPADQPAYSAAPPPAGTPSYAAAPPPAASPYGGGPQPGGLLDRFLARLIDGILLAIVNGLLVTVIILGAVMGESGTNFMYSTGASYAAAAVSALISVAIQMGYFTYMESSRGQTVGKMVMKLRTLAPNGGNPTVEEAARRNSFYAIGLLGLVPVLGGIVSGLLSLVAVIMIAVNINSDTVNRQGWHDRFAGGTRVIKLP